MLSTDTINVIKSTVPLLEENGQRITDTFYEDLFQQHPFLLNIFNQANQGKGDQSRALSDAVIAYAKHIDNLEAILPVVQRIAHKHVSLNVKADHYAVVGTTLLAAIQKVLALPDAHPALTAWAEAYELLAGVFINAENALYQEGAEKNGGWQGFREFYIERIVAETSEVKSFYLKPLDLLPTPDFSGGQYLGVKSRPSSEGKYQIRQYSLSQKGDFRITVKAEPNGLVSNYLHACDVNDTLSLQIPSGVFTLSDQKPKQVFIAGGVGITPMMSMLQEALAKNTPAEDILFIQCSQTPEQQIFADELAQMANDSGFTYLRCFDDSDEGDHQGFINQSILETWLSHYGFSGQNSQVYFCGPKPFMSTLNSIFTQLQFDPKDIHFEVFGPTTAL